jgi:hypothetical protein
LPPELIDSIIGLSRSDKAVLATCALVCRSWVPASRRRLFSQLAISRRNSSDASKLLLSAASTISCAVEHPVLSRIQDLTDLHEIICRLPNLTKLSIRRSPILFRKVFPPPALTPMPCNLESLQIISVTIEADHHLYSVLRQCPRLRSLSFVGGSFGYLGACAWHGKLIEDQGSLTPDLKSLKVHAGTALLGLLAAGWMDAAPQLTTLDLDVVSSAELDGSVQKLLEVVGSTVQVFRFSVEPDMLCECLRTTATIACNSCSR